MKNFKILQISIYTNIAFWLIITWSCKSNKENDITHLMTSDSIQYFKSIVNYEHNNENISIFSFDQKGKNERYYYSKKKELYLYPYFEKPRLEDYGISNNWQILNDSTIKMMGISDWIIKRYNEDTIFLVNSKDKNILRTLIRMKISPKVNVKSIKIRDSLQMQRMKEPEPEITESNN